jgi:hypothetical protein
MKCILRYTSIVNLYKVFTLVGVGLFTSLTISSTGGLLNHNLRPTLETQKRTPNVKNTCMLMVAKRVSLNYISNYVINRFNHQEQKRLTPTKITMKRAVIL